MSISTNTYFGIEIEICIDKGFYDGGLGHTRYESNYGNAGSDWKLPPGTKGGSGSKNYDRIILSQDMSCRCPPDMVSAEIISPKCNIKNFPFYREFLLKKVFSNMSSLEQGLTCGIHIHWSNDKIIPKEFMLDDRFMFLLAFNIYRTSIICDTILRTPEISGRHHHYSRACSLSITNSDLDPDIICEPGAAVDLIRSLKSIETIGTALKRVSSKQHVYFGIRFSTLVDAIIESIGDRRTLSRELDIFYDMKGALDRFKLKPNINWSPGFEWRLGEAGPHAAKFLVAFDKIMGMNRRLESEEYISLEELYNYTRESWWPLYDDVIDTHNIDVVGAMVTHNKKAMMNIIDLNDIHFEFRIFSLDTLFEAGRPSGQEIISRLEDFIYFSEGYCTGIVKAVVRAFKETGGDIALLKNNDGYMKTFMYGEYYRKNAGSELIDRLLTRSGVML